MMADVPMLSTPVGSSNFARSLPEIRPLGDRVRLDRQAKLALRVGLGIAILWLTSFWFGFTTILSVCSALGFVLAIVGLRLPMLGVLGIGIICTLDALMRNYLMKGGLLRYNTFNYWLLIVSFLSLPILARKLKDPQTRLLQAFVALLLVQTIGTPSIRFAALHLLNLVTVFGLLVYFYRSRRNPHVWYVLGLTIGSLSALVGFAFFYNTQGLSCVSVDELAYLDPDYRDPKYIDANALGYTFLAGIFSLCLALSSIRRSRGRSVLPILALLGINFCWIVLVGSRGSMLVGSSCLLYVIASLRSNTGRLKFLAVAAIAALFAVNMFPHLLDRSFGRVEKLLSSKYTAAQRTSARSDLAIGTWRLFINHPLGVGTGGFKKAWAKLDVYDLTSGQVGQEKAAHTAWGKTLAENGLPGFVLFTTFVFSFAYFGIKQRRQGVMPIGLLATMALSSAFVSTEFQSKGIWFLVAATITYLHYRQELPVRTPRRRPPTKYKDPFHPRSAAPSCPPSMTRPSPKPQKVLVTGGAGCIGSDLAERLFQQGHRVIVLDNLSSGRVGHIQGLLDHERFHFIEGDLLDQSALDRAMDSVEMVYHLAANPDVKFTPGDPTDKDLRQNTLATYAVLETMRPQRCQESCFFVDLGDLWCLRKAADRRSSSRQGRFRSTVPASLACEGLIYSFQHLFDMQCWVFRFANIVGPKVRTRGRTVIGDFAHKLLTTTRRDCRFSVTASRPSRTCEATNALTAMLHAVEHANDPLNIFNLGCSDWITVDRIAELVVEAMELSDVRVRVHRDRRRMGG